MHSTGKNISSGDEGLWSCPHLAAFWNRPPPGELLEAWPGDPTSRFSPRWGGAGTGLSSCLKQPPPPSQNKAKCENTCKTVIEICGTPEINVINISGFQNTGHQALKDSNENKSQRQRKTIKASPCRMVLLML